VFLDATYLKARVDHRIVSRAVVVATGVAQDGDREVLDLEVGDSEDELFWAQFLRRLRDRGLGGGAPGHLRFPRRAQASHGQDPARGGLAALICSHTSRTGRPRLSPPPAGEGLWQRDLRGPTADQPLPSVAGS
jgi:hypothetical protein